MTPYRLLSHLRRTANVRLIVGVLVVAFASAACSGGAVPSSTAATAAPAARPSAAATPSDPCATATCSAVPDLTGMTAPQARTALSSANFTAPSDLAAKADDVTINAQSPGAGTTVPVTTPILLSYRTPPPPPAPARAISARDWALIAKDPNSHAGERVVVYGQVKQFDAATGTSAFRANVDGVVHKVSYGYADYETNTFLTGSAQLLKDLVNDDLFRAEVTVTGAYSYDTTIGGNITAPKLEVTAIKVTGTAK